MWIHPNGEVEVGGGVGGGEWRDEEEEEKEQKKMMKKNLTIWMTHATSSGRGSSVCILAWLSSSL